ncbi:glycosyltransferase family 2 protein [Flavobacterium sp. xlx-214]|uniref:glycosyltransferase family 2 protein n=1 Tax=unclassified Flavobacterium TaxID=196869 RepID=UPI0013D499F2|nr:MULTISPECIES: glycosyltransferase family A protein [unclassified Flavobacterium]MBA5794031.1 glycosyltransferase family 2 protein [Flavobacterium sp. xlx-221]QMI83154.1 glycosyltransferase family 2 protein [Flavobacterium sp. xlx-214]
MKMQNKSEVLLSIIIPTRNRTSYVIAAALQVLENTSDKVQVVLQDNSDDEGLMDFFKNSIFLERIKYNYSPGILSFVDNFSKGVEISDGEYLCMIGDDDGINPEIEKVVFWAKENNIEAISPDISLNYIWPGVGINYYKKDSGNLMIIDFDSEVKIFDSKSELNKLLSTGGQNYLRYNLAKIYHGIITKSAMDKVKSITGKYFGGLSPDIYGAVTLSLVVDKVLKINYPLTIPGVCRKSGSGHSSTGRHHGELDTAPQLAGHDNYQWSYLVPRFYSVETLWADTALAALTEMKRLDLVEKFDVATLSAYCYKNYKEFNNYTDVNYDNYCQINRFGNLIKTFKLFNGYIKGPINDLIVRIKGRLKRGNNSIENHQDIQNINEAYLVFNDYLKRKNYSPFKNLK